MPSCSVMSSALNECELTDQTNSRLWIQSQDCYSFVLRDWGTASQVPGIPKEYPRNTPG